MQDAMIYRSIVIVCLLISSLIPAAHAQADYSIGQPRVWTYDRVYPFLDGIFQDVASTQVSQLTMSPNSPNASNLDASLMSFSASAAYSPLSGLQNGLAGQQNAVVTANAALQTQLLGQQAQLTQQLINANQELSVANTTLAQAQAANPINANTVTAAQAQVAQATNQLNTVTAQLTAVKSQIPATILGSQTYSSPTPPTSSGISLPTALTGLTEPPGGSAPNFPVSKQMDNQVNLLWERLSRLVATLSQADNMSKYRFALVSFNIDLRPTREKKKIFETEFCIVVADGNNPSYDGTACPADGADQPRVVDLFPSASAINIVDNKYHDSHWSLAALLGFPSVGLTAAFNQEHLRMSQSLGQSALITGFGIGTSHFGWAFGRNLGDDQVAPGNRTVFAIVAIPIGDSESPTQKLAIRVNRAAWHKENISSWNEPVLDLKTEITRSPWSPSCVVYTEAATAGDCILSKLTISSIDYNPIEFDPTAVTNNPASVEVTFNHAIDPQLTVSLDGRIIPRARDTFGRAVSSGGSQGLLESNTYGSDTWIPISSKKIALQLNPARLERRFPEIVFAGPMASIALQSPDTVTLAGISLRCGEDKCSSSELPPLAYRKSSVKTP